MFSVILKLLGIGLPAIINELTKEKQVLANATTESQRIEAEENIKILEQKKEIILQAQKNRLGEIVRLAWALPFIIYIWKLILWDKVLGWGATDSLSPTLEYIMWTILGGYFLISGIEKVRK